MTDIFETVKSQVKIADVVEQLGIKGFVRFTAKRPHHFPSTETQTYSLALVAVRQATSLRSCQR